MALCPAAAWTTEGDEAIAVMARVVAVPERWMSTQSRLEPAVSKKTLMRWRPAVSEGAPSARFVQVCQPPVPVKDAGARLWPSTFKRRVLVPVVAEATRAVKV